MRAVESILDPAHLRADSATAVALVDRLLSIEIEGAEPWPVLDPGSGAARIFGRRERHDTIPAFVLEDGLPSGASRWKGRAGLVDMRAWRARDPRLPGILYRPGRVLRRGPFAMVSLDSETHFRRAPDEAPLGYAEGVRLYLMETDAGWVVVSGSRWQT